MPKKKENNHIINGNTPFLIHPDSISTLSQYKLPTTNTKREDLSANFNASTIIEIGSGVSEQVNKIGVIKIHGPIEHHQSLMGWWYGFPNVIDIKKQFDALINDNSIKTILFDIDSPGGQVAGTVAFAEHIFNNRDKKPIVAIANEHAFSAAYWIGSACEKFYLTSKTAQVGSIGVIMTLTTYANPDAWGDKYTVIYAGEEKADGNPFQELTKEAISKFQTQIDKIYDLFVTDVAKHRNVDKKTVLNTMAEGRTFLGESAIENGLVDGIMTYDETIDSIYNSLTNKDNKMNAIQYVQSVYGIEVKTEEEAFKVISEKATESKETIEALKKSNTDLASDLKDLKESIVSKDAINEAIDAKITEAKKGFNDPEALVNIALAQGKITKAETETYLDLAKSDYAATKEKLDAKEINSAVKSSNLKDKADAEDENEKPKSRVDRIKSLL